MCCVCCERVHVRPLPSDGSALEFIYRFINFVLRLPIFPHALEHDYDGHRRGRIRLLLPGGHGADKGFAIAFFRAILSFTQVEYGGGERDESVRTSTNTRSI